MKLRKLLAMKENVNVYHGKITEFTTEDGKVVKHYGTYQTQAKRVRVSKKQRRKLKKELETKE